MIKEFLTQAWKGLPHALLCLGIITFVFGTIVLGITVSVWYTAPFVLFLFLLQALFQYAMICYAFGSND